MISINYAELCKLHLDFFKYPNYLLIALESCVDRFIFQADVVSEHRGDVA